MKSLRTLLPIVLMVVSCAVAGCSDSPDSPTDRTDAGASDEKLARAAAAGAEAGRAMARSIQATEMARKSAAAAPAEVSIPESTQERPVDADGFREIDWLQMIPADELNNLQDAPPVMHSGKLKMQQYGNYTVVPTVLGHRVKLPGYVVPMESDDKGLMTEFFFVPFFGACIHVPPPPPNQLIYVTLEKPMKTPEIWDPYWLMGELSDEQKHSGVAGSAYTMKRGRLKEYEG